MSKYSKQFKLAVINQYLLGTTGFKSVAKRHGIADSMVRRWVERYRLRGAEGLDKKYNCYDANFKLSVLKHMWDHHLSYNETAILFDIRSPGCLSGWERRYHSGGSDALIPPTRGRPNKMPAPRITKPQSTDDEPAIKDKNRTREELLAEVSHLRMENAYLKKLKALVQEQAQAASFKKRK